MILDKLCENGPMCKSVKAMDTTPYKSYSINNIVCELLQGKSTTIAVYVKVHICLMLYQKQITIHYVGHGLWSLHIRDI